MLLRLLSLLPDHPDVWTDGSLVLDRVTGVSSSGAGFFCLGRLVFGIRNGLMFLHLLSALRTLLNGPIILVS